MFPLLDEPLKKMFTLEVRVVVDKIMPRVRIYARSCLVCDTKHKLELHRIVPRKAEGKYTKENCIYLCKYHHNRVHSLIINKWGEQYQKLNLNFNDFYKIVLDTIIEFNFEIVAGGSQPRG